MKKVLMIFSVLIFIFSNFVLVEAYQPIKSVVDNHEGELDKITTTQLIELWHYSGGYWGGILEKKIYDNDMDFWSDPEGMQNDIGLRVDFDIALTPTVKQYIASGGGVDIVIGIPTSIRNDEGHKPEYKVENDILYVRSTPQYNILNDPKFKDYISDITNYIPIPEPGYGINIYSVFQNGIHKGKALGTHTPEMELDNIGYADIQDSSGKLKPGRNITIYLEDSQGKETGNTITVPSGELTIGSGTFKNAGAVGLRFYYPMEITFYKVSNSFQPKLTVKYVDFSTGATLSSNVKKLPVSTTSPVLHTETLGSSYEILEWVIQEDGKRGTSKTVDVEFTRETPEKTLVIEVIRKEAPLPNYNANPENEPQLNINTQSVTWTETRYDGNGDPYYPNFYAELELITELNKTHSKSGYGFEARAATTVRTNYDKDTIRGVSGVTVRVPNAESKYAEFRLDHRSAVSMQPDYLISNLFNNWSLPVNPASPADIRSKSIYIPSMFNDGAYRVQFETETVNTPGGTLQLTHDMFIDVEGYMHEDDHSSAG